MLCENCKKNTANTYFKQTVNGKTREVFLCSECAAKLGLGDSMMNFGNFGFGLSAVSDLLGVTSPAVSRCPTCGMTLKEVSDSGMMGCADCYDTFRDYLRKLLPRISGNKVHTGKTPRTAQGETGDGLDALKVKLAEAVKTENFEEATVLRDKIRALESEIKEKGEQSNEG